MSVKQVSRALILVAGSCLYATQAQASLVATGQVDFGPPSIGNAFSGTVYAEIFDLGGGTFSRTGDSVGATGGDFTAVFQVVMNADTGSDPAWLADLSFAAYQLGPGDFGNPDVTNGGVYGADPTFSITGTPGFRSAQFTFGSGGLAEGATSNAFYFLHQNLDLSGDTLFVGGSGVYSGGTNSFNTSLMLTAIPVPAAVWLFGSGLVGLTGLARRKRS